MHKHRLNFQLQPYETYESIPNIYTYIKNLLFLILEKEHVTYMTGILMPFESNNIQVIQCSYLEHNN